MMVSEDIIRKFVAQIKEKHKEISEPTIEKDFYLTLLLNEISKNIEENKESLFSKLVFKGGTLLTRTHLNYHRISEDLDFTYLENKKFNKISAKQRKKVISNTTDKLVKEINKISKKLNLDFSTNKSDKKYCEVMDRKKVYVFRIYYTPIYGADEFIKFEVNFNDELIYPVLYEDIKHLFDAELVKDLEFVENLKIQIRKNIPCYDLKEIAGEKIRAILTRPAIKERDLLDLFLISNTINLEKDLDKKRIVNKIISSKFFIKGLSEKIKENIELLTKNRGAIIEERSKLTLIQIKEKEYSDFEKKTIPFLAEIGEQALIALV
ncbi:MAG TPA: nucleotidyl transferase AbiEii/AbiGii toxin family protein [Candidatus Paceibacterota bacterium]|nr:nucleotidyl transferase AbiEii/AbiGii toxin family protein [Candidatus Paceibacterota bacterium]